MDLNAPWPIKDLYTIGLPWLYDKIEHHSLYPRLIDAHGKALDYKLWVRWALSQGFVWLYPCPPKVGLIARPISRKMIEHQQQMAEEDLLVIFDRAGDGLWVDFLWAPGEWLTIMRFLRGTGKAWVGWQHRTTFQPHIVEINIKREVHHTVDRRSPLLKYVA